MSEPRWLAYARTLIGTREIPGPKHSPVIMGWIKKLGPKILGINVTDDETPWCGTFMAHVMHENGIMPPKALPAWTDADFACGKEPNIPPQRTTKAAAESYLAETFQGGNQTSEHQANRTHDSTEIGPFFSCS